MKIYDQSTFERHGYTFRVHMPDDDSNDAPWDREDGHGPVRTGSKDQKRPGERILHNDRITYWLYDWQAACKLARTDGWNAEPFDAPNRIERAVQADFDRLSGWLDGQWCYIGVCVELMTDDGPVSNKYDYALWGIESDAGDYLTEVANENADECLRDLGLMPEQRRTAWLGALHEARERRYWAARDVGTRS